MTSRSVTTEADRGLLLKWHDVLGYEDRYQATRCGRVRSKPRYVNSPAAGGQRMIKGKELRLANVKGYWAVAPLIGGKRRTLYVHRMLADLFIPNPDNKPCVNHIDGDKQNNAVENLEWCSHQENMTHAYATGLAKAPDIGPGERCPASKLTDAKVRYIKQRILAGDSHVSLARQFGVRKGTIGCIARGETWRHIEP